MKLTALQIKNAEPKDKLYKLSDGQGLQLVIHPNGGKYWWLAYRFDGKQKTLTLGTLADLSLAEARKRRDEARKLLANDQDPSEVKKAQERQRRLTTANSFEAVAREWHEMKKPRWAENHANRVISSFERDVFPIIGQRPVAEIVPAEILDVIRQVEARDALDYSHRVLQRIGSVYSYAKITERATNNPADGLSGALKKRTVKHRLALPVARLPEFRERLSAYDGHLVTKLGLELILLTFVRPDELRKAEWSEFQLDKKQWVIPAHRMKMKREHIIPLSEQAIAVIEQLRPITGHYPLVFAGHYNPRSPMSEGTLSKALAKLGYKNVATPHGFRSLASTVMNEYGFNTDAIERQLAHSATDKIKAAYNRSEYLKERTAMMQWWADFTEGKAQNTAKIIQMARKSA